MWEVILPIVITLIVAIIAAIITFIGIGNWYRYQDRAPGAPPDWAFALIWTVLYIAFAYAWIRGLWYAPNDGIKQFVNLLFLISIILNLIWVIAFFYLHNITASMVTLVIMLVVGFLLLVSLGYDLFAAYLVGAYTLWLIFALMLNAFYYNKTA